MKKFSLKTTVGFVMIFVILTSCQQSGNRDKTNQAKVVIKNEFKAGETYSSVLCSWDTSESYALYIPSSAKEELMPLLVLFDPHGGGNFVINKYKNLANEFGFVLAASNSSKNGLPFSQSGSIAGNLVADVINRVNIDTARVYSAGFSGGAKVAIALAKQNIMVRGVVYSGSAMQLEDSKNTFSLLGIAGNRDMNYSELLQFDKGISTTFPHYLIEWNGKHEWPDSAAYRKAFYWLAFDGMKRKVVPVNEELISKYSKDFSASNKDKTLERAEELKEQASFLNGIADTGETNKLLESLQGDAAIQKQMAQKNKLTEQEQVLHEEYYKNLYLRDLVWWRSEIKRLGNSNTGAQGAMDQRLLGFISLACYSICGKLVHQDDNVTAQKLLTIYKIADPENADQRYFNAIFLARHKKNKETVEQLKEAARLGFTDKAKVMSEPAFSSLTNDPAFKQAVEMMTGERK